MHSGLSICSILYLGRNAPTPVPLQAYTTYDSSVWGGAKPPHLASHKRHLVLLLSGDRAGDGSIAFPYANAAATAVATTPAAVDHGRVRANGVVVSEDSGAHGGDDGVGAFGHPCCIIAWAFRSWRTPGKEEAVEGHSR